MKKLLLLILSLGYQLVTCSQNFSMENRYDWEFNTLSPEAASLVRSVNNPVDYCRGQVDISIPLFDIVIDKNVTIPITLSYNHTGFKVDALSYWLGQGWNLNVEPTIVRTIRSGMDTSTHPYNPIDIGNFSQYELQRAAKSDYNGEPDNFYYALPRKKGSFMFVSDKGNSVNNEAVTIPFEPVKISKISESQLSIIDENGTDYLFGGNDKWESCDGTILSWKCSSITSPLTGETVGFDYYTETTEEPVYTCAGMIEDVPHTIGSYDDISYSSSDRDLWKEVSKSKYVVNELPYYVDLMGQCRKYEAEEQFSGEHSGGLSYDFNAYAGYYNPFTISKKYQKTKLKSIIYHNGTIFFSATKNRRGQYILNEIDVINKEGVLIKKVTFHNSFTFDDYPILDSLNIYGKGDLLIDHYKLEYKNKSDTNSRRPELANTDCWGNLMAETTSSTKPQVYYNSNLNLQSCLQGNQEWSLVPSYLLPSFERIMEASQTCMLGAITNITGCRTEFAYESNYYSPKGYDKIYAMGGLRIREINYIDLVTGKKTTRTFEYGKEWKTGDKHCENFSSDACGLGLAKRYIIEGDYMDIQCRVVKDNSKECETSVSRIRTYLVNLKGNSTYSGSPIVYDRVIEYQCTEQDGEIIDNGKIVYTYDFDQFQDSPIIASSKLFHRFYEDQKTDWLFGQLLSKEVYANHSGNYKLVSKSDYRYKTFNSIQEKKIDCYKIYQQVISPYSKNILLSEAQLNELYTLTGGCTPYIYYTYSILGGCVKKQTEEIDSVFTDNGVIVTNKKYQYDNLEHLFLTSVKTNLEGGKVSIRALKYPQDLKFIDNKDAEQARLNLIDYWQISPILEVEEQIIDGSQSHSVYQHYNFRLFDERSYIAKETIKYDNGPFQELYKCLAYDDNGHPLTIIKDSNFPITYLWSITGELIAKIENATNSQVVESFGLSNVEDLINLKSHSINRFKELSSLLRKSLPQAHIHTYLFESLVGVICSTDPSGLVTHYVYDSANRLMTISQEMNGMDCVVKSFRYNYCPLQ